jgi:hypothetical protein
VECIFHLNSMESGRNSNGNCSGRLPDSNHSARFRRIPSDCPWNWKLEWLRLQPTEFQRILPELMGECKDLIYHISISRSAFSTFKTLLNIVDNGKQHLTLIIHIKVAQSRANHNFYYLDLHISWRYFN